MKFLPAAAAIAMFGVGSTASADTGDARPSMRAPRLYVASRMAVEISDANQFEFDAGVGGVLAAGLEIGKRWRFEFAFSRRHTNITGIPPLDAEGEFASWTHMGNAYWHPFGLDARFSPYVGAGVGYNVVKLEALTIHASPALNGLGYPAQRHVGVAAQGQIGLAIRATDNLNVDIAGAYYTSLDNQYVSTFPNNPTVEAAYRTYSGQVGIRYAF